MPQIAVIPTQHWNFKATPQNIDVAKILREAAEAGESLVRIRVRFIDGIRPYLFILRASDDAKALPPMLGKRSTKGAVFIATKDIRYTPLGLVFDNTAEEYGDWIMVAGEDIINQVIQQIYKQRSLLKRRQRVTVECL